MVDSENFGVLISLLFIVYGLFIVTNTVSITDDNVMTIGIILAALTLIFARRTRRE